MQAWAAIHGRSNVKLEDVSGGLDKIYFDALGAIPYFTGGKSYNDKKAQDIEQLRQEYKSHMAARAARKQVKA